MHKINIFKQIEKEKEKTKIGLLTINNIKICPDKLQEYVSEIMLSNENLEFVFNHPIETKRDNINMLKTFLPAVVESDLEQKLQEYIDRNVNFYSFFAEALLAVAYRDVFNFNLCSAVLDMNCTPVDTNTGVDACMYDEKNNTLVLGEAKFYKSLSSGIKAIKTDLTENDGFLNKLDSFKRRAENNEESNYIILRALNKREFETISLEAFLGLKIIYSGFVLHEHTGKTDKYEQDKYYNDYIFTAKEISDNIKKILGKDIVTNHSIALLHLPIKNKKELIKLIIQNAKNKIEEVKNGY